MKITRIEVHQAELAYAGGVYRLSGGREYRAFDATILSLHCDDGTVGWGESTPFGSTYVAAHAGGVRAALDLLAPARVRRTRRPRRWCTAGIRSARTRGSTAAMWRQVR